MELAYTPEENAFRETVRGFIRANLPADIQDKVLNGKQMGREDYLRWHRALHKQGWVAPNWPVEHGGTGWTPVERHIFEDEAAEAGAPPVIPFGVTMCGPVVIRFGSAWQKEFFLPRILSGEHVWCQGFSEPGSGSDLASLRTKAVREGDNYIVVGSKGGAPTHPTWLGNIKANPDVEVEVANDTGTETFKARARVVESRQERDRLYKEMTKIWPAFADYQARTERLIPVIVLERQRGEEPKA